ncbi:MAG: hypothetical protein ACRDLP_15730 [Solirubrobacteraceae bacterium]
MRRTAGIPRRQHRIALYVNHERKQVLLRIDPTVHDALARWASDEFRSLNAHIEMLLRRALDDAGRMPREAGPMPRRGRPSTRQP